MGEEEAVPCTEQHPAPFGTFSHTAAQGVPSHPGRAAGEKTPRTKAHEPDFEATVRTHGWDSAQQGWEPSKRVPQKQVGAASRAPTPAAAQRGAAGKAAPCSTL